MPTITVATGWNSITGVHPNHESDLLEADVKAIVLQILTDITGMNAVTQPTGMGDRIWMLAQRLQSTDGRVIVQKGIHQRTTDVHITLNLPPMGGGDRGLEVFLQAVDRPHDSGSSPLVRFEYKPVGITTIVGPKDSMVMQKWPATFAYTTRNDHGGIGRTRSRSIGSGVIDA